MFLGRKLASNRKIAASRTLNGRALFCTHEVKALLAHYVLVIADSHRLPLSQGAD